MSVRTRLKRIEQQRRHERRGPQHIERSEEDWLDWFTAHGKRGALDHESDFPVALAVYRNAIEEAIKRNDPPFYPPDDYEPRLPRSTRHKRWQGQHHFPEVDKGWFWLADMSQRPNEGIPPVTEAEFGELASWFSANWRRIRDIEERSSPIVIDGKRIPDRGNISYGLTYNGSRALGAGEVAQHVRRLRAEIGDGA